MCSHRLKNTTVGKRHSPFVLCRNQHDTTFLNCVDETLKGTCCSLVTVGIKGFGLLYGTIAVDDDDVMSPHLHTRVRVNIRANI